MSDLKCVKALYAFQPPTAQHLTLSAGDIVVVLQEDPAGWHRGLHNLKVGWFPHNYVEATSAAPDPQDAARAQEYLKRMRDMMAAKQAQQPQQQQQQQQV